MGRSGNLPKGSPVARGAAETRPVTLTKSTVVATPCEAAPGEGHVALFFLMREPDKWFALVPLRNKHIMVFGPQL